MRTTGIHHHKVTPKWPQANGEVERQNQSMEKRLRIAHAEGQNWREALLSYIAVYWATPHATTGKSPAEVLFGRKIRTKMPEIKEIRDDQEMRDHDAEKKGAAKLYADSRCGARYSAIRPGDNVLVRQESGGKLDTPYYHQPYTVVSRSGSMMTVKSPAGVLYKRNVSGVKKYQSRATPSEVVGSPIRDAQPEGPDDVPEVVTSIPDEVARVPETPEAAASRVNNQVATVALQEGRDGTGNHLSDMKILCHIFNCARIIKKVKVCDSWNEFQ
ncbi:uncharacterized protein [Narcine bancroftii]|uniref:uncharacterized protein n=1 Tax=Narcine bancroftii TaxID=1343680 RepID=UPI003831DD9C